MRSLNIYLTGTPMKKCHLPWISRSFEALDRKYSCKFWRTKSKKCRALKIWQLRSYVFNQAFSNAAFMQTHLLFCWWDCIIWTIKVNWVYRVQQGLFFFIEKDTILKGISTGLQQTIVHCYDQRSEILQRPFQTCIMTARMLDKIYAPPPPKKEQVRKTTRWFSLPYFSAASNSVWCVG